MTADTVAELYRDAGRAEVAEADIARRVADLATLTPAVVRAAARRIGVGGAMGRDAGRNLAALVKVIRDRRGMLDRPGY